MSDNTQLASTNTKVTTSTDADYKQLYEASEKGRRNAQAELTPVQQELSRLRAENAILKEQPGANVDSTEQDRLNDLKFSDPDKWRAEMNESDKSQAQAYEDRVKTKQAEIVTEMTQEQLVANTKAFFANKDIDPAVVINSMPKALQSMIDQGEITLDEGLQRGIDLVNGATVKSVLAPATPNLASVAGSDKPTDQAKMQQSNQDWSNMVV